MSSFDPKAYGPILAELVRDRRLNPLGAGTPNLVLRPRLETLLMKEAVAPQRIHDERMADACRAGLWLLHNFLDESHTISQDIATPTGSYWHALMHRREPDFGNAAHWFRRVGRHPVFETVRAAAAELAAAEPYAASAFLVTQKEWDPFAFIDLCERCLSGRAACEMLCRQIQLCEWEILFDHCYRQAIGMER